MAMSTIDLLIQNCSEAIEQLRIVRHQLIKLKMRKERESRWQKNQNQY